MIKRGNLSAQTTQNQLQTQYKELKFVEEAVSLEPTGQIDVLCNTKKITDKILSRKSNWKMQQVKSQKKIQISKEKPW